MGLQTISGLEDSGKLSLWITVSFIESQNALDWKGPLEVI